MSDNGKIVKNIGQGLPEYRLGNPTDLAIGVYRDARYLAARFEDRGWFAELGKLLSDEASAREGITIQTFADGATTPSIGGSGHWRVFLTANSGATTITRFDSLPHGKAIRVTIIFGDANTTIAYGAANIITAGGTAIGGYIGATNDVIEFITDGSKAIQCAPVSQNS